MNVKTGIGIDVHAFATNRKLILAGVDIPFELGLDGHSDADVVAHAIMDALLGAARLADIGELFPDTDDKFKNANSLLLLAQVGQLIKNQNYLIEDIDCVIAAQSPKIYPYKEQMRKNIATALNINIDQVGLKATTTEGLGFVGQKQGIAAFATCLLSGSNIQKPC
ncbi:MAG: 2-C-methyl-D-erythritol 2,4-cyclodiphosphate synthase [Coriobacteriales bacterium]|nr:2-C-methyl-D-erythritol 2,4-cyclodiphosphate synthase [Coriobacteriales bacterium]